MSAPAGTQRLSAERSLTMMPVHSILRKIGQGLGGSSHVGAGVMSGSAVHDSQDAQLCV